MIEAEEIKLTTTVSELAERLEKRRGSLYSLVQQVDRLEEIRFRGTAQPKRKRILGPIVEIASGEIRRCGCSTTSFSAVEIFARRRSATSCASSLWTIAYSPIGVLHMEFAKHVLERFLRTSQRGSRAQTLSKQTAQTKTASYTRSRSTVRTGERFLLQTK
jgi:hypothetical protein